MKLLKTFLALTALLLTSVIAGGAIAQATGWNPLPIVGVLAASGLLGLVPTGVLAVTSSVSIDAFKASFGSYYKPGGQNADRLKKLLMLDDTPFNSQFTLTPLEGDVLEYGLMAHSRVLQPFKPKWSPTGQLSGTPRKITLRRVKVNVEEIPDHFVNTWLGFLATEGGKDPNINRATWPFVRWYVEKYLIPQARQDQYMEAYYGVWADPGTDATPGAEGTALDGLAMQINTDIDATNITAFTTGAFDSDSEIFVEQIEDFVEGAITKQYRGLPLTINMDDTFVHRFKEGMDLAWNTNYAGQPEGTLASIRLRKNIKLVGHHNWLQGVGGAASQKLICTPTDNMVKAVRIGSKEDSVLRLEQIDYTLKLFNDWHVLYSYYDPRIMFTNDRELAYGI